MRNTLFLCIAVSLICIRGLHGNERRITSASQGHMLTNVSVWSPNGEWIVYDTRKTPENFDGTRIERVNVKTGEVQCLYESQNGATCGVATYHPVEEKVIFILGPEHPTPDWNYGFSRRRGVFVETQKRGEAHALDAMNYSPPFVAGALRGGSHVHIFSGDGTRVSFTYDDEILSQLGSNALEPNQRNIGVAGPGGPVRVNRNHSRNNNGEYFSTIVTHTTTNPRPGTDEIDRACEEGWIGTDGFQKPDGTHQKYALAFQGQVRDRQGKSHYEVFAVDLPEDLTKAGSAPLEGTETTRLAPPKGVIQRRLTFTTDRKYPGIQGPRHWLRAAPDGSQIAFLMKDDAGIVQIFLISPNGGAIRQLTHNPWDISSAFTWNPDGSLIAHAMDNSVFVTDVHSGESRRITPRTGDGEFPQSYACVFSPDGSRIAYARRQPAGHDQLFVTSVSPIQ